jgi:hypothetical protein
MAGTPKRGRGWDWSPTVPSGNTPSDLRILTLHPTSFFFFLSIQGFEHRVSHLLRGTVPLEPHPQPFSALIIFLHRFSHWTVVFYLPLFNSWDYRCVLPCPLYTSPLKGSTTSLAPFWESSLHHQGFGDI